MNAQNQARITVENALKEAWAKVNDESLVEEFFLTEKDLPKGLMAEEATQNYWRMGMLRKYVIVQEFSRRFGHAKKYE